MDLIRGLTIGAAAFTVGVMSGVMALYANTIMPGLRRTDDRTFVGAFQAIDTRIINPLFLVTFMGALALTVVAAILSVGSDDAWVLVLTATAGVLYLVVVVATVTINVPLNDAIKAAGDPDAIDVTQVRADFREERWVRSNMARAILTSIAFALLLGALFLHARALG